MLQAFEHVFDTIHRSVINDGTFINNEHINVFLVTLLDRVSLDAFELQARSQQPRFDTLQ